MLEELDPTDKAVKYYNKALSIIESSNPFYYTILTDLSVFYCKRGDYQEAVKLLSQANSYYQTAGSPSTKANFYNTLSCLHYKLLNKQECLAYAQQALNLLGLTSLSTQEAILDTAACAYLLNENYALAEKYTRAAIKAADKISHFDENLKQSYYKRLEELKQRSSPINP